MSITERLKNGLMDNPFQTCFVLVIVVIIVVFFLAVGATETNSSCGLYKRADGGKCIKDDCGNREIQIKDGYCEQCPDYQIAGSDKLSCFEPTECEDDLALTKEGNCESCRWNHYPFKQKDVK